ncbi:hypothetical protein E1B28_007532 [Marasmius oreades]|uniref:ATP-dependent DNA ligase family profile domain-containing protein n=1 Tax=Marasmius oreades TaxID=181124 RepID=A0A9P7S2D3_9AGAR|nr:uncharacterized protein E1B28_007532 [Marasmius oreades]KAG7093893.1 hypothetical protein E1B28_007532 [Marasmius oreades]
MSQEIPDGIPFTFFTSLIREIAKDTSPNTHGQPQNPLDTFNRWLQKLRNDFSPFPPGTTSAIFRFLFPHEDARRKFGMQETALSRELAKCLCISDSRLLEWETKGETISLGDQLRHILEPACSDLGAICSLNVTAVDALLDELAAISRFSANSIRAKFPRKRRRSRETILKELFRPLSPFDSACLTQIILKDLRPLMYPLCEKQLHYTTALKEFRSNCVIELSRFNAMKAWDPTYALIKNHRVCCSLDNACDAFERNEPITKPTVGAQLEVPKSQKGRDFRHALSFLSRSKKVWAETKYDGERAQIHVKITNGRPKIKIFSKSKRDSTDDRIAVHSIILECLGLDTSTFEDVILDAEMVPFNGEKIEGFWKIRRLIESTASGARRKVAKDTEPESPETQFTQSSKEEDCPSHLGLIFFDVMHLNGRSLLTRPYHERRGILETLIRVLPGKALLAERWEIDMSNLGRQGGLSSWLPPKRKVTEDNHYGSPETRLGRIFARTLASHEEGLILKAAESTYNDWVLPWVKLKQDYIPGLGDALDLVIVGAGWQKERALELRIPRTTLITFYIGALTNAEEMAVNPAAKPHFLIYFTSSYGLTRGELEEANFLVKSNDPVHYYDKSKHKTLFYDFTLATHTHLQVLLREPLLAELFGDRFTKARDEGYFEIRWPRITKIHRTSERSWRDGLSLSELQAVASQTIGMDHDIDLDAARIWKGKDAILPTDDWRGRCRKWEVRLGVAERDVVPPQKRHRGSELRTSQLAEDLQDMASDYSSRTLRVTTNLPQASAHSEKPLSQEGGVAESYASSENSQSSLIATSSLFRAIIRKYPSPPTSPVDTRPPVVNQYADVNKRSSASFATENDGIDFLQAAVVWYDVEVGIGQMSDLALAYLQTNRVHSLEALLTGSGWHPITSGSPWIQRAVVFLDPKTEGGRLFEQDLLLSLKQRLGSIPTHVRKPVWIFNSQTFNWSEPYRRQALSIVR